MRPWLWLSIPVLVLAVLPPAGPRAQAPAPRQFYENRWHHDSAKGYYYKRYFYKENPADRTHRHQYVIYKPTRTREFVYWFNPQTQKYWACCPTVHHPQFGPQVKAGKDLWAMLPNDKKKDRLDAIGPDDFEPVKNVCPPVPGSKDGGMIETPPRDLPPN